MKGLFKVVVLGENWLLNLNMFLRLYFDINLGLERLNGERNLSGEGLLNFDSFEERLVLGRWFVL